MDRDVFEKAERYERLQAEIQQEKADAFHHHLIIQREAVGFRDHKDVERLYRIPDPIEAPDFAP